MENLVSSDEKLIKIFLQLCEHSVFSHREELLRGITAGEYSLISRSKSEAAAIQLLEIYSFRADRLVEKRSRHAQALRQDTLNLISELKKQPNDKVCLWRFSINEVSEYTVFEGIRSQKILGCLLSVDRRKVSESEWEKIWTE